MANGSAFRVALSRAQKILLSALETDPESIELLTCLGAVYLDEGDPGRARTFLQKAVSLGSRDSNTYFNLGLAITQQRPHREVDQLLGYKFFHKEKRLRGSSATWRAYFDFHGQ